MPRINQYPLLAAPEEEDRLLGWDASENKTVSIPTGGAARRARGTWQCTRNVIGLGSWAAVPWEAAAQRLDEILTELPANLTVDCYRLDGSWETGTRVGGQWTGESGALRITPGCGLHLHGSNVFGSVKVTCQLTGANRPFYLDLPATADSAHGIYIRNPLPRWRGVRELFVDTMAPELSGLGVVLYLRENLALQCEYAWGLDRNEGHFRVPPGALIKVYSTTGQAIGLQWNRDDVTDKTFGVAEAAENAYIAARDPQSTDGLTFCPGVIWVNRLTQNAFVCVSVDVNGIAVWKSI